MGRERERRCRCPNKMKEGRNVICTADNLPITPLLNGVSLSRSRFMKKVTNTAREVETFFPQSIWGDFSFQLRLNHGARRILHTHANPVGAASEILFGFYEV